MYRTSNSAYGSSVVTRNKEQMSQKTQDVDPIRIGIENIGNTCYINSMLQCLFNTPAISTAMKTYRDNKNSTELFKQFYKIWFSIQAGIEPEHNDIIQFKKLMNQHKEFDNFNQQDCIEFFHVFLDIVNTAFLTQPFFGQLTYQINCQNCNNSSKQTEQFITLSIYIEQSCRLSQLLQDYFKPEQLNSQEKCKKCQKTNPLIRKTNLSATPMVLVIQLKRYDSRQVRSNNAIEIEQNLILKGFCDQNPQYKLYAVINHQGYSIYSGHYTCLIKGKDCWYNFNDQRVSEYSNKVVDDELQKSQNSYVLFYQRQ